MIKPLEYGNKRVRTNCFVIEVKWANMMGYVQNRDRPIYRFADIFGRYQYRYIGMGELDIGIGLLVSVSVIG